MPIRIHTLKSNFTVVDNQPEVKVIQKSGVNELAIGDYNNNNYASIEDAKGVFDVYYDGKLLTEESSLSGENKFCMCVEKKDIVNSGTKVYVRRINVKVVVAIVNEESVTITVPVDINKTFSIPTH